MFVDQYDAIRTLKRSTRRANIHARWIFAVLTHQWQGYFSSTLLLYQVHLVDPFCIGLGMASILETMFLRASCNTSIATTCATIGVYQHTPARPVACGLLIILCKSKGD